VNLAFAGLSILYNASCNSLTLLRSHSTATPLKENLFRVHSKRRIVNSYKIRQSGCFRIGDLQSGEKPDWRLTQIGEFLIGFYESSPIRLLWPGLEISIPKFFLIL